MSAEDSAIPHAGAVRARAQVAQRALFLARIGESVLIGASATLFAMVCVLLEGGRTDRLGTVLVALLCGVLAGATWAISHRCTAFEVAQRVDRNMDLGGAFVTAWEQDGADRGGPLAELLVLSAARNVPGRIAARTVIPQSWPILAAPFLIGAWLAALSGGEAPARALQREQHERVAAQLGALAGTSTDRRELSFDEERALRDLARSAAALAGQHRSADESSQARSELVEELRALGERLPGGSEVGRRLDELAGRLEAAAGGGAGNVDPDGLEGSGGPPLARRGANGTIAARETRPGSAWGAETRSESAWIDPRAVPPDLARILDDWDAAPLGETGR